MLVPVNELLDLIGKSLVSITKTGLSVVGDLWLSPCCPVKVAIKFNTALKKSN